MSSTGGRVTDRWRRGTALAVAFAFLLVSFAAAEHQHERPPRFGCTLHHQSDHAERAAFTPEHPGDCFACFWGRTAVAASLAIRPHFAPPAALLRRTPAVALRIPRSLPSGSSSRAPPLSLV